MRTLFVDANVIIHYLLRDHIGMHRAAVQLFQQAERGEYVLFIEPMVMAECIHVLTGPIYQRRREDVARVLAEILLLDGVTCEHPDLLTESLTMFAERNVDFIDAYLACRSREQDASVASFDPVFQHLDVNVHLLEVEGDV